MVRVEGPAPLPDIGREDENLYGESERVEGLALRSDTGGGGARPTRLLTHPLLG